MLDIVEHEAARTTGQHFLCWRNQTVFAEIQLRLGCVCGGGRESIGTEWANLREREREREYIHTSAVSRRVQQQQIAGNFASAPKQPHQQQFNKRQLLFVRTYFINKLPPNDPILRLPP